MMPVDLSRLTYNDTITYRRGFAIQPGIEDQDASNGPYKALVVDIGERLRGEGRWHARRSAPLYRVHSGYPEHRAKNRP
jgi:hypothetical protein